MLELLHSLLDDPDALSQAVRGAGMTQGEIAALSRNLRNVIAKLGRAGDYALLLAFLDHVDAIAQRSKNAADRPSSLS